MGRYTICPYCGTEYEIVKYPGSYEPVEREELEATQDHTQTLKKLLESARIDRNAIAERAVQLNQQLTAMTATMQQWRDLASGYEKELAHLKKVHTGVMDVPGVIALLVKHLLEPWDDNQAGLDEPEPLPWEEDDDAQ